LISTGDNVIVSGSISAARLCGVGRLQCNSPKVNLSRPVYKKDFHVRFQRARADSKLTLKELATRVGVSFQTIQRWEKGERTPERIAAQKAAQVLQTDFGEPWLSRYASETLVEIPVIAFVAGGRPIDQVIEGETVAVDPRIIKITGEICGLKVKGDSMTDQHILDQDVLICRKTAEPRNKSIVVVDFREAIGASVKFWYRRGDAVRLSSDRDAKEGEKFEYSAAKLGKVYEIVGLIRSVR
jgi:SOS-response transcriptional repressor LexA